MPYDREGSLEKSLGVLLQGFPTCEDAAPLWGVRYLTTKTYPNIGCADCDLAMYSSLPLAPGKTTGED